MKLIRSREKLKDKGREFVVSREKTPSRILENVNENLNCEPVARSFPSNVYRTHGVETKHRSTTLLASKRRGDRVDVKRLAAEFECETTR